MSEGKKVAHFNKGTVWGRVDGVPTRKLSGEGKGRPYYRIKVSGFTSMPVIQLLEWSAKIEEYPDHEAQS